MKKILVLVFLFSCSFCSYSHAQTDPNQTGTKDTSGPHLKFVYKSNIIDFGGIGKNTNTTYEFGFKNSGDQSLVIADMHSDDVKKGCKMHIDFPKKPIKPGKFGVIRVTYTAGEEIGSFKNEIYINSNATTPDFALLHVSGAVVPVHGIYNDKLPPPQKKGANKDVAVYEIIGESVIKIVEEAQK